MKKLALIAIIALFGVKIASAHPRPAAVIVIKEYHHHRCYRPIVISPTPPPRPVVVVAPTPRPVVVMPMPPRFAHRHHCHRM